MRCLFCDAEATRFCDAVIGGVSAGWYKPPRGAPYKIMTVESMTETPHTCDAPFCARHGVVVGWICGEEPDTIDHCIGCRNEKRGLGAGLMEPGAIEAMRKQWHAEYRRQRGVRLTTVKAD